MPKSATFVGVAHYSKTGPSLTSVGWNSSLASDGLRIPGGVQGIFEDFTPGNIEPLWHAAFPPGTLRGRIGYGLYGVSGSGYWAVIYSRHRQLEALMAHGADARAAKALSWPTLALGLSVADMERRWPALSLLDTRPTTRCMTDPPLYTPTALVHRLLVVGIAPITPMTANLNLISRQSMVFEGIPWFAFQENPNKRSTFVTEVDTAGFARRLGWYPAVHDQILSRCWGVATVGGGRGMAGVMLPRSLDRVVGASQRIQVQLLRALLETRGYRISAAEVESVTFGDVTELSILGLTSQSADLLLAAGAAADGELLGQVPDASRLVLMPPNGPAPRAPRIGGRPALEPPAADRVAS